MRTAPCGAVLFLSYRPRQHGGRVDAVELLPMLPLEPLVLAEPPALPEVALPLVPDEPLIPEPEAEPDAAVFSLG